MAFTLYFPLITAEKSMLLLLERILLLICLTAAAK